MEENTVLEKDESVFEKIYARLQAAMNEIEPILQQLKLDRLDQKIFAIMALVKTLVVTIEAVSKEFGSVDSATKKQLAAKWLNDRVDIPWIGEGIEQMIFEGAVDMLVAQYNALHSKAWFDAIEVRTKDVWAFMLKNFG